MTPPRIPTAETTVAKMPHGPNRRWRSGGAIDEGCRRMESFTSGLFMASGYPTSAECGVSPGLGGA